MQTTILVLLISFLLSCSQKPAKNENPCETRLRALLDVGSGATKLNVSEIEVCGSTVRVKRVLDDKSESELGLEAGKDKKGNLTPEIQERALKVLTEMRDKALATAKAGAPNATSLEMVAVGTHAARTAGNAAELTRKVQALGFALVPISQQQEGEFGYLGTMKNHRPSDCKNYPYVVWDAGGGSQQLTWKDTTGKMRVHPVSFSAEYFRQKLVHVIGERPAGTRCAGGKPSPNPIGAKNFERALNLARGLARTSLADFRYKDTESCLIGIGGVHTRGIESLLQAVFPHIQRCICEIPTCTHSPNAYTRQELACLAKFLAEKSDCDPELKGPFSTVTASNAIMILGFMEEMRADAMQTMKINMSQELITNNTWLPWTSLKL